MGDVARLEEAEIAKWLGETGSWTRKGDEIERLFEFGDFQEAFAFLTRVAIMAEKADHHPEIWNVYNKVKLSLTTHDAGGLTHKDLALAARIDAVVGD